MKLTPTPQGERALTLAEVMFVVVVLVVLVVAWLSIAPVARARAERQKCHNIQRSVALGFRVFANDNGEKFPFAVSNSLAYGNVVQAWLHSQTMSSELGSARILLCPSDRERLLNIKSDFGSGASGLGSAGNAAVSYAPSLDADQTRPNAVLLIDRNLVTNTWNLRGSLLLAISNGPPLEWDQRIHGFSGNAALADGSVGMLSNPDLAARVRVQGLSTNRLLLPLLP